MPFINLKGEREATTQKSEEYGKKVIELLGLKGYFLEYDSNIEGTFQDKIFRNPKKDGNKKTVVEIKDTKLSMSDSTFLMEYAKYFLIYLKEDFNLFIFATDVANVRKWKQIFSLETQAESEVKALYNKMCDLLDDYKFDYDSFYKFINSTVIWQGDYTKLIQTIEQIKSDNIFDFNVSYLDDTEKLTYESEKLDSNLFLVNSYPKIIFKAKLKVNSKFNNFWKKSDADCFVQYKGILYSVEEIPDDVLEEFCELGSYGKFNFSNIDIIRESKFISQLIRSQIILNAFKNGFYYERDRNVLYKPHRDLSHDIQKVKVEDEQLRFLSKIYRKKDDGSINFFLHRGVTFKVMYLSGEFYGVFDTFRLFSSDGRRLITGKASKKLNDKFPPTMAYNDAEKSKLFFLLKAVGLPKWSSSAQSSLANFETFSSNQFTFELVSFEIECKAQIGDIFNENFDYEDNFYTKISDYEE